MALWVGAALLAFGALSAWPVFAPYTRANVKHARQFAAGGERVVIVGASSGIGEQLAHLYAKRGARLLLLARREQQLANVKQACIALGAKQVQYLCVDVRDAGAIHRSKAFAMEQLAGVDTLIVCAGALTITPFAAVAASPDADTVIRAVFEMNALAPIRIAQEYLELLRVSRGSLVVVSSMAGLLPAPTRALYCASKYALHGFFDSVQIEERRHNVFISLVCPGTVATDLRGAALDKDLWRPGMPQGTSKGAVTALQVAELVQRTSDERRHHRVLIPRWYSVMVALRTVAPSLVDYLAAKKYGYR
ncbi:hypothetical protein RI367_003219 [Sorochytrium milnesiophthora]